MKVEKLRDLSTNELVRKVDSLKEELFNLRFQNYARISPEPKPFCVNVKLKNKHRGF